ncbi:unnamed protein product [Prunus brigantina]
MKEEKCSVTEDIFLSVCRGYVCVHRPLHAVRVFLKMEDFQCKPTQKSYITILGILVEENQLKIAFSSSMGAALRIFCEMPNHGCPPDSDTYGTLINGLCKLGKIGEAKELFNEMETKGCLPSVVTSLMDGLCKGGRSSQAMELLDLMVSKRHKPNNITYSTLLHGFCEEGKLQEALEILDRMKLQGMKPDAGLYGKVISSFCNICKFQEAAVAIQIELVSLKCICKKGDLHKAYQIVDEMVLDGCVLDEGIWNSMVDGFWNRKKVPKWLIRKHKSESFELDSRLLGDIHVALLRLIIKDIEDVARTPTGLGVNQKMVLCC